MKQKVTLIFIILIGGISSTGCASTVQTGEIGIRTSFGKLVKTENPGLHFYTPFKGDIQKLNLQSQTITIPIPAYSKDSQIAPENKIQVTFSLLENEAERVFKRYGQQYKVSQVEPRVANIFREEFGTRNALQIVQNRQELNNAVQTRLTKELQSLGLEVEAVNISIKFSAAFEKVAEEAAIARSQANKAEQELQRVKFEEQQKLARAEADKQVKVFQAQAQAESIRLQTEELNRNPNYIKLLEAQTKLKAAENWNGQLPNYMGSSAIPFIQLPEPSN
ncbi:MAG: prohibitin family protein [Xenococcaceae cyanobacterium MO_188.B29]|nr:prohibitin family protein [Xenococcaceae cyanobacterium MO_188.B29]